MAIISPTNSKQNPHILKLGTLPFYNFFSFFINTLPFHNIPVDFLMLMLESSKRYIFSVQLKITLSYDNNVLCVYHFLKKLEPNKANISHSYTLVKQNEVSFHKTRANRSHLHTAFHSYAFLY